MDDVIYRQDAIDALGERPLTWTGGDYELGCRNQYDADKIAIETVPSVDAVEVVRCKDCKSFSHGYCKFHDAKFVREDGYCYWGERKNG